jgi:hypothetical protein
MKTTVKFLTAAVLFAALTGCGKAAPTGSDFVVTQRAATKATAQAATRQESVINIVAPAANRGTGSIAMGFKFPQKDGYSVMATANDIAKLTVTLKTKSFLLSKTVATADVLKSQIVANKAAVNFTGLAGGNYTVEIAALDATGANLGSDSQAVTVTEGQTSTVNSKLQLKSTPVAGVTALGVNVEVVNGN